MVFPWFLTWVPTLRAVGIRGRPLEVERPCTCHRSRRPQPCLGAEGAMETMEQVGEAPEKKSHWKKGDFNQKHGDFMDFNPEFHGFHGILSKKNGD